MINKLRSTLQRKNKQNKPQLHPSRVPSAFKEIKMYALIDRPENAHIIYLDTIIAMLPVIAWSVYLYGFRPLTVTVISVIMTLGLDVAARTALRKDLSFDLSPVITGLVTAICLPPSSPLWLPVFAALIGTAVRHASFRAQKNVLNSAAVAVLVCFIAFPGIMSSIPEAGQWQDPFAFTVSGYEPSGKGALETVIAGFLPEQGPGELFFGLRAGMIGEMSAFLLIGGALYLCIRGIYKPLLPTVYLLSVVILAYLNPSLAAASDTVAINGALYNIFGGNTMVCAVYMAADPVTTPRSPLGTVIAGAVGGAVTIGVRYFLNVELSALCGVLAINILSPILDSFIRRAPFGGDLKPDTEAIIN